MAKPNPYVRRLRRTLKGTPLAPYAQLIARMETKYRLPKGIIAGIARAETSFGTAGAGPSMNNYWGWMTGAGPPNQRSFANPQRAIRQYAAFLSKNYGGQTPEQIVRKYVGSDSPDWVSNVRSVMSQFGGGVPAVTSPGRNPPRNAAPRAALDDRTRKLLALQILQMASAPEIDYEGMLPFIQMIADFKPNPKTGRPSVEPPAGGLGPQDASVKLYKKGAGFLLPAPGFKTTHATSNLPGYPAYDFMIPDGTPVYADWSGTVNRLSGHDGYSKGFGGRSYYITTSNGRKLFLTHFDYKRTLLKPGQKIREGQLLGYVQPGAGHIHFAYAS